MESKYTPKVAERKINISSPYYSQPYPQGQDTRTPVAGARAANRNPA
jgi:hypothetical protein